MSDSSASCSDFLSKATPPPDDGDAATPGDLLFESDDRAIGDNREARVAAASGSAAPGVAAAALAAAALGGVGGIGAVGCTGGGTPPSFSL